MPGTAIQRARAVADTPRPTPYRDEARHLQKLRHIAARFPRRVEVSPGVEGPGLEDTCPLGVEALAGLGRMAMKASDRTAAARRLALLDHGWRP